MNPSPVKIFAVNPPKFGWTVETVLKSVDVVDPAM